MGHLLSRTQIIWPLIHKNSALKKIPEVIFNSDCSDNPDILYQKYDPCVL